MTEEEEIDARLEQLDRLLEAAQALLENAVEQFRLLRKALERKD